MQGVVLAVDGQDLSPVVERLLRHVLAGHDERFLVCQGDVATESERFVSRHQAKRPDQRTDDQVDSVVRGDRDQTVFAVEHTAAPLDAPLELGGGVGVPYADRLGFHAANLLLEQIEVAARRQRHDLERIRKSFDDIERTHSDRTRRSEDGQSFHCTVPDKKIRK